MDYLGLATNTSCLRMLDGKREGTQVRERIIFSTKLTKINKKGKEQKRAFLLTDRAVYNLKPGKYDRSLRRIEIRHIAGLSTSLSGFFVIYVLGSYEYQYKSDLMEKLVIALSQRFNEITGGKLKIEGSMVGPEDQDDIDRRKCEEEVEQRKADTRRAELRKLAETRVAKKVELEQRPRTDDEDYITRAEYNRKAEKSRALRMGRLKELNKDKENQLGRQKNYQSAMHDSTTFHDQLVDAHNKVQALDQTRKKEAIRRMRMEQDYLRGNYEENVDYFADERGNDAPDFNFTTHRPESASDVEEEEDPEETSEDLSSSDSEDEGIIPADASFQDAMIIFNKLKKEAIAGEDFEEAQRLKIIQEEIKNERAEGKEFVIPDEFKPKPKPKKEKKKKRKEDLPKAVPQEVIPDVPDKYLRQLPTPGLEHLPLRDWDYDARANRAGPDILPAESSSDEEPRPTPKRKPRIKIKVKSRKPNNAATRQSNRSEPQLLSFQGDDDLPPPPPPPLEDLPPEPSQQHATPNNYHSQHREPHPEDFYQPEANRKADKRTQRRELPDGVEVTSSRHGRENSEVVQKKYKNQRALRNELLRLNNKAMEDAQARASKASTATWSSNY